MDGLTHGLEHCRKLTDGILLSQLGLFTQLQHLVDQRLVIAHPREEDAGGIWAALDVGFRRVEDGSGAEPARHVVSCPSGSIVPFMP